MTMYAGLVGVLFALVEGKFLDHVKSLGTSAFSWLFVFGMAFGLISLLLFLPQADVKIEEDEHNRNLLQHVVESLRNRPLMVMMLVGIVWSLQSVASPFYATYLLRDLHLPFVGVGAINAAGSLTMLLSSPWWGQVVSNYGSRPVVILTCLAAAPTQMIWLFVDKAALAYALVIPVNLVGGFLVAGFVVAMNTMLYKVTPSVGRSVQIAVYSIIVVLCAAPMPAAGGQLPGLLKSMGIHSDLRITFYTVTPIMLASGLIARWMREDGAVPLRVMLRDAAGRLGVSTK
jgi:MFS family permease